MKAIVVLTFELDSPDDIGEVLLAIDPPNLPKFAGKARVSVDPYASKVEEYLDE